MKLYLATQNGFTTAAGDGANWEAEDRSLADHHVTTVIARDGVLLAGTRDGIYRSDDEGANWEEASHGLTIRHVRWLAFHPEMPDREFAGTEPAGLFVSQDGGEQWRLCPEVPELRDRYGWSLPYSPEAGCVRGFAFHGQRGYAAVEVGGALRSDDAGEHWRLVEGSDGRPSHGRPPAGHVHADVHSIAVHPSSPDLVVASTGGGLYRSDDGGQVWQPLFWNYTRAVWLDPQDPDHLIAGPADGVSRGGRIEQSFDGGQSWQLASNGLDVPWPRAMVERFVDLGGTLLAMLSDGRLYAAPLATLEWQRVLEEVAGIEAVTTMEEG